MLVLLDLLFSCFPLFLQNKFHLNIPLVGYNAMQAQLVEVIYELTLLNFYPYICVTDLHYTIVNKESSTLYPKKKKSIVQRLRHLICTTRLVSTNTILEFILKSVYVVRTTIFYFLLDKGCITFLVLQYYPML